MMGTSHAVSGAAAWVAVTATAVPALGLYDIAPAYVLLGAVIAAGAALLPDADHHNATIAHSVPIAGRIAAGAVGMATGGHRKGMHSILAVAAVLVGMVYLGELIWQPDGWTSSIHVGAAAAAGVCVTFAVKSLKMVRSWPVAWLIGIGVGGLVGFLAPEQAAWLPWCIGTGYLVHLLGDMLTEGGVPLLWPIPLRPPKWWMDTPLISRLWLPGGGFAVPVLGTTGSWREQLLMLAMGIYAVVGLGAEAVAAIRIAL